MPDAADRPDKNWTILFVCWLFVTGATFGSLFFSEIMELPPCSLCWYQRIFMFPLPIVLFMGLFPFDPKVVRYALPLAIGGCAVALYHTLLHVGIIPESIAPCSQGVSCSTAYLLVHTVDAVVHDFVLNPTHGIDTVTFVDELVRMLHTYITG